MQNDSDARYWDIDKARLLGVIDRLHSAIDGLTEANRKLTESNQELAHVNKELVRTLAERRPSGQSAAPRPANRSADAA